MYGLPTTTIAKTTLTSDAASVTLNVDTSVLSFSGGTNSDPRHLVIRVNSRPVGSDGSIYLRFNGDTGNNYNYGNILGYDTTEGYEYRENQSRFWLIATDGASNEFGIGEYIVPDAFSTRGHKTLLGMGGRDHGSFGTMLQAGRWANTAAITSVTFVDLSGTNIEASSYFELAVVDESYSIYQGINTGDGHFDTGAGGASISAADGDLVVVGSLKSALATVEEVAVYFNDDTTEGNYLRQRLNGHQAEVAAYSTSTSVMGHAAGGSGNHAEAFGGLVAQVPSFSDTTTNTDRMMVGMAGGHMSDTGDSDKSEVAQSVVTWDNTAAVTRISIEGRNTADFVADSMLSIYKVPKGLITRTELTSSANDVSFTSIPDTYDHLEVTTLARSDRSATGEAILMSLTADGGSKDATDSNYSLQSFMGNGSTASASSNENEGRAIALGVGDNETANVFGLVTTTIFNYRLTDRHKSYLSWVGYGDTNSGAEVRINRWKNTAEIDAITIEPKVGTNFLAGTIIELRGISTTIPDAPGPADIKKINGIAAANIKKVNTIAKASLGKVNSIT